MRYYALCQTQDKDYVILRFSAQTKQEVRNQLPKEYLGVKKVIHVSDRQIKINKNKVIISF